MNDLDKLYDKIDNTKVDVTYPGLDNQDIREFCQYFHVDFHSLRALGTMPAGVPPSDLFRVTTQKFPVSGLDVTYHSVLSWKEASKYFVEPVAGVELQTSFAGLVTVVAVAEDFESQAGKVVVFRNAEGAVKYVPAAKFSGMSYDRLNDTYRANSMLPNAEKSLREQA